MPKPTILRKRFIPDETVDISADEILRLESDILITRWKPIKPRDDFDSGISYTYLKEGYKISQFKKSGKLIYHYCDIIDIEIDKETNTYKLIDLLVDVKVMPDGKVIVMDLEEVAQALELKLIDQEQACRALRKLDKLLSKIYAGDFPPKECEEV